MSKYAKYRRLAAGLLRLLLDEDEKGVGRERRDTSHMGTMRHVVAVVRIAALAAAIISL